MNEYVSIRMASAFEREFQHVCKCDSCWLEYTTEKNDGEEKEGRYPRIEQIFH